MVKNSINIGSDSVKKLLYKYCCAIVNIINFGRLVYQYYWPNVIIGTNTSIMNLKSGNLLA